MDIFQMIDNLPDGVAKVSLFVGNERQQLDQVYTFDHLPDTQDIQEQLRVEGYGSEFRFARLIFRDEKGKQLKSHSMRKTVPLQNHTLQANQDRLVDGYLSMQRNYAQFFTHLTARLDASDEKFDRLRRELLDMQHELMEARTTAAALDVKAMEADDNESNNWHKAFEVAETLGAAYIYGRQENVSPESFLEQAQNNPSFIEALLGNEAVAKFIQDKFFKSKSVSNPVEDVKALESVVETEEP